jgi:transcriptional regulator with XRE-family HTH domain
MSSLLAAMRSAREQRGWTQADLAARLGVSQSTISFWENGVEVPMLEHQVQLVAAMPEILTALAAQEFSLLDRIQALERTVYGGKCGCQGCNCSSETPASAAAPGAGA